MTLYVSIDNVTNARMEMTKGRRNGYMILNGAVATTMEKISNDGVATTMVTVKTGMEKKSQRNSPKRHENFNEMQGVT